MGLLDGVLGKRGWAVSRSRGWVRDRIRTGCPIDEKNGYTMITQTLTELWLERDLTWQEFNRRVLAEALDELNQK